MRKKATVRTLFPPALVAALLCLPCMVRAETIALWTFDGPVDADVPSTPAGHPAAVANVSGGAQCLTERSRTFLRLPGAEGQDCVTLGEGSAFDLPTQFSLEAWFRPHPSPPGSYTMILGKRYNHQYQLDWTPNGGGTIEFFVGGGHLTQNRAYTDGIEPGRWLHIVAVYDASRSTGPNQWLHVNGALVDAARNPVTLGPSSAPLRIAQNSEMSMKNNVKADWDEVAVHDHAMSAQEIAARYEAKAERARKPAGPVWVPATAAAQWRSQEEAAETHSDVDRMSGIKQTGATAQGGEGAVRATPDGTHFTLAGTPPTRVTSSWELTFPEPVDLTELPYCFIRYRARGIQRAMQPVPILTLRGGDPQALLTSSVTIQDDLWHSCVVKIEGARWATGLSVWLALQGSRADLQLCDIRFTADLDTLPTPTGLRTTAPEAAQINGFRMIDLGRSYNDSLAERAERLLSTGDTCVRNPLTRFRSATITWAGVPFAVAKQGPDVMTPEPANAEANQELVEVFGVSVPRAAFLPVSRDDTLTVPVDASVAEVFMLLSCDFPAIRKRYSRPPVPLAFTDSEAFGVGLHYDDGTVEELLPYSLEHRGYRVCGLTGAYVVAADPAKRLQEVVFHNRTWGHTVGLAALTARTSTRRLFPALASEPPLVLPPPVQPTSPRSATVTLEGKTLRIENTHGEIVFDCSRGFRIADILPRWSRTRVTLDPSSGLEIEHAGALLSGTDLECADVSVKGTTARISLRSPGPETPLRLSLTISARDNSEVVFEVEIINTGTESVTPLVRFPAIRGAVIGSAEDTWIFFPQYRNVMTNRSSFCKQPNHRGFPMQFMDIYSPASGVGLCVMTQSLSGEPVEYCISKNDAGADMHIENGGKEYPLPLARAITPCPRVMLLHPGDWHAAAKAYQRWTERWYTAVGGQDKAWLRDAVWLRSHLSSPTSAKRIGRVPPIVEPETKRFRIAEYLEQDARLFGLSPDIIHFYVWAFDPLGTGDAERNGEYGGPDYDNLGGLANFAAAIQEIQKGRGMPVSLYTIWDRCSRSTPFVKEHGERFAKVRYTGQKLVNGDTVYMATSTPVWRVHAAETLARLQHDTQVQVLYLDVFGSDHRSRCLNPDAGHPVPSRVSQGDRDFLRAVRQAQPEGIALWGEFPTTDIASQYWDGFISYDCIPLHTYLAEDYDVDDSAPLWSSMTLPPNSLRFVFPKLKQAVFPVGQEDFIDSWRFMKFLLFNGQALFDTTWRLYETECRTKLGKSLHIMREYADCFSSDRPRMFVPTLRARLYANEWPGRGRTVWTLFNARYQTLDGNVLRVPHRLGATYRDLWNNRAIAPEIQDTWATLSLRLIPQGIGCIAQSTPAE